MNTPDLNLPEWQCLLRCARGQRVSDCGLATLARLEQLGLMIRAGTGHHLVTARGLQLLEQAASPAPRAQRVLADGTAQAAV
ncbi:hypothetical protein D0B54_00990 [Solimonas sp. K1W22B-7]|uniref:hypothetical protein n=1 Tax=Solimonas sp. K1W22B-7 TaxID=2303331 RepID=UPI000E33751D|nr:hypothetical protein [Solimonas sp. K1W22B-7]AXQ27349.1 hypothetical protein D0B54_00990 [Solimonas sp. K1W22B-7]